MEAELKIFTKSQQREAREYALNGGQSLLMLGVDEAQLYDQDARRLKHFAVRLGVWGTVRVECEGTLKQYVTLSRKPLLRAMEILERSQNRVVCAEAMPFAEMLVDILGPVCKRIDVSGELRRQEVAIHGIDILVEMRFDYVKHALPSDIDDLLQPLRRQDQIRYETFGNYSKKFYIPLLHIWGHIYVIMPPATWGVRSVQMTGPDDFSHWMMSHRKTGGALPNHLVVKNGAVYDKRKAKLSTQEEADFFDLCGLPHISPYNRFARWSK